MEVFISVFSLIFSLILARFRQSRTVWICQEACW